MPWKPLPSVAFAICTYPFAATEPNDLPLEIGDHIYIIEQGGSRNEWYRGYLVAPPSILAGLTSDRGQQLEHRVFSGIFPTNCVEVREILGDSANGRSNAEDALFDDDDENWREKRKSQVQAARRLSRKLSLKPSARDLTKKGSAMTVPDEPMPRMPGAPKPAAPVPLLRVGDESGSSAEEPLVDEIASCLREWHDARLHEILLARGYSQLARVQDLIKRVDNSRNQLMHDVMTIKELAVLREDTVWELVAGNKLLNDEVIVRSPTEKGRILTAEDSVIEMTKLQANMSILDRPPRSTVDKHMLFHLLVDVRSIICETDQPATLQICLFLKNYGEKPRPISENFAINLPLPEYAHPIEDQAKTLFMNLSNTDVGIGAESSLFLVFKLLRDEPIRQPHSATHAVEKAPIEERSGSLSKQGSLRGRRSFLGSQRKRDGHTRSGSAASTRPETSMTRHSDDASRNNSTVEASVSVEGKVVRRTVGIGAVEVTRLAQTGASGERSVTLWSANAAVDERNPPSGDWNDVIRDLMRSATGGFSRVNFAKRFDVMVKGFASPDVHALVRETPTLLHDILTTPKLGFSGVPGEQRSDIYLTLTEPRIPRNASLAHSKFGVVPLNQRCQTAMANLQLTLEVRKSDGERIEDCIYTASNHQGHTAWRTTGIERGEGWNQTIRLSIPAHEVPGSHVVMSIADAPNFPFALAWVPLWEMDAFVRDGDHSVALYVYDEFSSSIINGKGAYLGLPPWHDRSDGSQGNAAIISLKTFLVSTEYSQDPTLLSLLTWRKYHGKALLEILERFVFVPEFEIVKLLSNVFTALFEILEEYDGNTDYEDLVFFNFVVVLSIARDKRFELGNVIQDHARSRPDWPYAGRCLVGAFRRLVTNPLDADSSKKLRETLKVGDLLLRLIVDTAKPNSKKEPDVRSVRSGPTPEDIKMGLQRDLNKLFVAVMALLRNPMPVLLGTQTLVVQHFHAWLPELEPIMTPSEILDVATDLLDASTHAQGRMIIHRLILMVHYSRLDVFKSRETRTTLVANTFRWLAPYWGDVGVVSDQWRDQVRLCCSVVAAQMEELGEESCQYVPKLTESYAILRKQQRAPKREFSLLFPNTFPFPTKTTEEEIEVDEAVLEISALLAAALTSDRKLYFDASQVDITGVLQQALQTIQSILACEAFPKSWLSLLVAHHKYGITALERISEVLIDSLPDIYAPDTAEALDFDTDIWRSFFQTLFTALSSAALAMETFPEQKRRAIWKIAGDVRELGANLLKRSWDAIGWDTDPSSRQLHGFERLGGYQVQFVPELVGPVVELCLSVHASLRNVAVDVLRSMIISAWEIDQDLSIIQTAMIDCLDKLCRTQSVTESVLQKTFVPEMLERFKPFQDSIERELHAAVVDMFSKIESLLNMLASVHQNGAATTDASRLVDTLHLMEFLKDVQSEEAFIRYVHQLADVQTNAGNPVEAGLALQMHADRYEWEPAQQLSAVKDPKFPAQTAFERKEALYFQMCQNFERGRSWQRALLAYRELATQYETNTFEFSKLARAQRAIAGIHERIAKGDRSSPRYFRVLFRGLGWPPSLKDKEFIFEGYQSDRLSTFEERLQQIYPGAQIFRSGGDLPVDADGQHMQVFAVSPNKDLAHTVYQRTKVSQAVREYNLLSNPQKFTTSSRTPARDVPITEQTVEKTVYTTAEPFPTILRRSEIVATTALTLAPLEAAIERTTRKTQELLANERHAAPGDDDVALERMTEDLLASVDPSSESSVARYRSLLPASEFTDSGSGEVDPATLNPDGSALDPMQNALKVALLDHALAIKRCLGLYRRPHHHATRAQLVPRFEAAFQHELSILYPHRQGLVGDETDPVWNDDAHDADLPPLVDPDKSAQTNGHHGEINGDGDAEPDSRRGRRGSLPFLRRASSRQRSVAADESGSGANGTRDSSRRDRSSSRRRLSLFRSDRGGAEGNERSSAATMTTTTTTMQDPRALKGMRSFRNSSHVAVTATGEYMG